MGSPKHVYFTFVIALMNIMVCVGNSKRAHKTSITIPQSIGKTFLNPIQTGRYIIVNQAYGVVVRAHYDSPLNGIIIHSMPYRPECQHPNQVYQLEYNATNGLHLMRWAGVIRGYRISPCSGGPYPCIHEYTAPPGLFSYWRLDAVPGTQFHTIFQTHLSNPGNIRYTGIANDRGGVNLDIFPPDIGSPEQWWEFVRCA